MFLQASVILSTGGGRVSASVHAGMTDTPRTRHTTPPDQAHHPPRTRHPPQEQTPPGTDTPPRTNTPLGSRLQHTVNMRPVRILLECILVRDVIYELWFFLCQVTSRGGNVGMSGGGYVQGYVQGGVGMSPPDMGAKRVLTPPWTWGTIGTAAKWAVYILLESFLFSRTVVNSYTL